MLECSLAKPQSDQKSGVSNTQKPGPGLLPSYPPHVGYGFGGAYGALGAGYPAPGLAQVTFFAFVFPLDITILWSLFCVNRNHYIDSK